MSDTFIVPDNWKLDSGLRDTVPKFTIVSAYFAQTASYQDGVPFRLFLIGFDESTEPFTVKMSLGADWVSSDGGRTITHPTKSRINNSSTYGHWLDYSMRTVGLREELINRTKTRVNGLGPLAADIWTGLILHLEAKEFQFGKRTDDNPPRNFLMPVEFLGVDTGQAATASASMVSAPAAPPQQAQAQPVNAAPTQAPATSPTPADAVAAARAARAQAAAPANPLMARLHELAKTSSSHTEFMNKAWEIDEVLADDALATQVATPDQIYNKARS